MREGDTVNWVGVNRVHTGVVVQVNGNGSYLVKMANEKCVIVDSKSILELKS